MTDGPRNATDFRTPDRLVAFIAYDSEQGGDFRRELVPWLRERGIDVRYDEESSLPGESFLRTIERMMAGARVVLYVMTPRSVDLDHWCAKEITREAEIGKPVIPLRIHPGVDRRGRDVPLPIQSVPAVDFVLDRAAGWSKLADQLAWLGTPEGSIYLLEGQLRQERLHSPADDLERRRHEARVRDLRHRIAEEQVRATDLALATRRQQHDIAEGQSHESRPEPFRVQETRIRSVGHPPAVPPNQFQDRIPDVTFLVEHLGDAGVRLVALTGDGGVGKTAVVHRLWEPPPGGPALPADGLVYLTGHGFRPVTAGILLRSLVGVLPDEASMTRLGDRLRVPAAATDKLDEILDALAGDDVVVVLDAVEELLDDRLEFRDEELGELVEHLLTRTAHGVRLLLAGRQVATPLLRRFPATTRSHRVGGGLELEDSRACLREMDVDGLLGSDHDLLRLHVPTGGLPRALELAYGLLRDRSLDGVLALLDGVPRAEVTARLFAAAFEGLARDRRDQAVVEALAIYGRPVTPAAVGYLVQDSVVGVPVGTVLDRLHARRLIRRDGGHFFLPVTPDGEYVLSTIPPGSPTDRGGTPHTRTALFHRAADHFALTKKQDPQEIGDLGAHLSEIELRVRGGEYARAFELMAEVDDRYLNGWGFSGALIPPLTELSRDVPDELRVHTLSLLARAEYQRERYGESIDHAGQALKLATGRRNRVSLHLQRAAAHTALGEWREAADEDRRAWRAAVRQASAGPQAAALVSRAVADSRQGRFDRALRGLDKAWHVLGRGVPEQDRDLAPNIKLNAGWAHTQRGETESARECLLEGERLAEAWGDRLLQARCLLGRAELLLDEQEFGAAVDVADQVADLGFEAGSRVLVREAKEILALACLCTNDLETAAEAARHAGRYRYSLLGFAMAGLVACRGGDEDTARATFLVGMAEARGQGVARAGYFQPLDRHGLVACGLAMCGDPEGEAAAVTAYRAARRITAAPGVVRRNLLLLDQFRVDRFPDESRRDAMTRIRRAAAGA